MVKLNYLHVEKTQIDRLCRMLIPGDQLVDSIFPFHFFVPADVELRRSSFNFNVTTDPHDTAGSPDQPVIGLIVGHPYWLSLTEESWVSLVVICIIVERFIKFRVEEVVCHNSVRFLI